MTVAACDRFLGMIVGVAVDVGDKIWDTVELDVSLAIMGILGTIAGLALAVSAATMSGSV